MEEITSLFERALEKRPSAIAYGISSALSERHPGKAVLEARNEWFDVQEYGRSGQCEVALKPGLHSQLETQWQEPGAGVRQRDCNAWYAVNWQGHALEVVTASWLEFYVHVRWQWIVAENMETARSFFEAVCEWCHEIRGEVLVFFEGCWQKSVELFRAVQTTGFDSLVLRGSMKDDIRRDFQQFLASREVHQQYGVPWKRGALLLGPAGNGKTHCVKALVNFLRIPCLYVQSFKEHYCDDQSGIKKVFGRARQSPPCLLVLEDIDSLVTSEGRSFFLNELDGFAENEGIITLATSNHPERLDPSILERPSRFDRKYYFESPGAEERQAYLSLWNERLDTAMRLVPDNLAELAGLTDGFSYAYLKELVLSSIVQWMSSRAAGEMMPLMCQQATKLREQMRHDDHPA